MRCEVDGDRYRTDETKAEDDPSPYLNEGRGWLGGFTLDAPLKILVAASELLGEADTAQFLHRRGACSEVEQ